MNLSSIETQISFELAIWINMFVSEDICVLENNNFYTNLREEEKELFNFNLPDFAVKIYNFENHNDLERRIKEIKENNIICSIDYKNNIEYLKYIDNLFILIDNQNSLDLAIDLYRAIKNDLKGINIDYIFLAPDLLYHENFIFYDYKRENKSTYYKNNYNQIALSTIASRIKMIDIEL